jgi:hypothetical protein
MRKFSKLNYNDTLNRLHELFHVENIIEMYSNKNICNKRYTEDEKMHNYIQYKYSIYSMYIIYIYNVRIILYIILL